jgi:parvulin-like peptidyl-prolyl isomerase
MHSEEKPESARRRRRGRGVPFGLVTLLVILALLCGGVLGYVGGAKFSQTARQLKEAEAANADYEMTLMEMYSDEFDRAAAAATDNANAALAGGDLGISTNTEPVVVAEFDGGVVMSDEAVEAYRTELAGYALGGADITDSAETILGEVLKDLVGEKLAYLKAEEKEYTTITDDDRAQIADEAQAQFDETVNFYVDMVREDGMSDEDAYNAAVKYLADNENYTIDGVNADVEAHWWHQKLYDDIVSGVNVTADQITNAYNAQEAAQQEEFSANPQAFETALLNGDLILYYPAGYRTVKHIFFALDDEAQARAAEIYDQLATEQDEATVASLNTELDGLYASAEAEAADVYDQLEKGGDFGALMLEYSDDAEMNGGAFSQTGYYVAQNSIAWSEMFIDACMALQNPGDISAPARTEGGVHIVLFVQNVQSGAVPLSQVNAEMTQSTLDSVRADAFAAAQQDWITAANVKYYPERLLEAE